MEVSESGKHSSLQIYGKIYGCKKVFYYRSQGPYSQHFIFLYLTMSLSLVCRFVSRACLLVTYDADEYAIVSKTQTFPHIEVAPLLMFHRATLKQTRVELIRVEEAPYVSVLKHTSLLW